MLRDNLNRLLHCANIAKGITICTLGSLLIAFPFRDRKHDWTNKVPSYEYVIVDEASHGYDADVIQVLNFIAYSY